MTSLIAHFIARKIAGTLADEKFQVEISNAHIDRVMMV